MVLYQAWILHKSLDQCRSDRESIFLQHSLPPTAPLFANQQKSSSHAEEPIRTEGGKEISVRFARRTQHNNVPCVLSGFAPLLKTIASSLTNLKKSIMNETPTGRRYKRNLNMDLKNIFLHVMYNWLTSLFLVDSLCAFFFSLSKLTERWFLPFRMLFVRRLSIFFIYPRISTSHEGWQGPGGTLE